MADIELRGVVLDDTGAAVSGANVDLYDVDTTSPSRSSTITNGFGLWSISHTTRGRFDVRIVNGSDTVWLRARDRVQFSTLTLNENGANQEALIATRSEDASVEVAIFEGDRANPADDDLAYISLKMSDDAGSQTEIGRIGWVMTDVSDSSEEGDIVFSVMDSATLTEFMRLDGSGGQVLISNANTKIGGSAVRGTTEPTNSLAIFNGTAPAGTLTNGITLYSASGELNVMDAAGNNTLLSPHADNGEWIYRSESPVTGKKLLIRMEEMMKRLDSQFGWGLIEETDL